jgi:hypothetical protein
MDRSDRAQRASEIVTWPPHPHHTPHTPPTKKKKNPNTQTKTKTKKQKKKKKTNKNNKKKKKKNQNQKPPTNTGKSFLAKHLHGISASRKCLHSKVGRGEGFWELVQFHRLMPTRFCRAYDRIPTMGVWSIVGAGRFLEFCRRAEESRGAVCGH